MKLIKQALKFLDLQPHEKEAMLCLTARELKRIQLALKVLKQLEHDAKNHPSPYPFDILEDAKQE